MTVLCRKCNRPLKADAKFCTSCGTVAEPVKPAPTSCACGHELTETLKFCPGCGLPNPQNQEKPEKPTIRLVYCRCGYANNDQARFCMKCGKAMQESQDIIKGTHAKDINTEDKPLTPARLQKIKSGETFSRRKNVMLIVSVVIILAILTYLFLRPAKTDIASFSLYSAEVSPSDTLQIIQCSDSFAITIPAGALTKPVRLTVSQVSGLPSAEDMRIAQAYQISLGKQTEFDGYIELRLQYKPQSIKPNHDLVCMYFNRQTNEWEQVAYEKEPKSNTIAVFTRHLSIFGVIEQPANITPSPMMKLPVPRYPGGRLMSRQQMTSLITGNVSDGNPSDNPAMEGWSAFTEWFGITGAGMDFAEGALFVDQLTDVNGIMDNLGIGFALAQATYDMTNDNKAEGVLNLTKELSNYGIKNIIFDTRAMNIAMVGVFAIDYSLGNFAETAISSRNEIYQKAYKLYYRERREQNGENSVWWYRQLKKALKGSNSHENAKETIDRLLNDYVTAFWRNEDIVSSYQEKVSGHAWTGGGGLNEKIKSEIAEAQLHELRVSLDWVFKRIPKELRMDFLDKLHKKMIEATRKLNMEHQLKVKVVKGKSGGIYENISLKDIEIIFDVKNPAQRDLWKGRTDRRGEFVLPFTWFGYLHAGAPRSVKALIEDPDGSGRKKEFLAKFKVAEKGNSTKVEIVLESNVGKDIWGLWEIEGTVVSISLIPSPMQDQWFEPVYIEKEKNRLQNSLPGKSFKIKALYLDPDNSGIRVNQMGNNLDIEISELRETYRVVLSGDDTFEGTLESREGYCFGCLDTKIKFKANSVYKIRGKKTSGHAIF